IITPSTIMSTVRSPKNTNVIGNRRPNKPKGSRSNVKKTTPKEFKRLTQKVKVPKGNAVALDPGVRIFQTTYDTEGTTYLIGKDGAKILDSLAGIATRMRAGIYRYYNNGKKKFRRAETDKERKGLLRAANKVEQRI